MRHIYSKLRRGAALFLLAAMLCSISSFASSQGYDFKVTAQDGTLKITGLPDGGIVTVIAELNGEEKYKNDLRVPYTGDVDKEHDMGFGFPVRSLEQGSYTVTVQVQSKIMGNVYRDDYGYIGAQRLTMTMGEAVPVNMGNIDPGNSDGLSRSRAVMKPYCPVYSSSSAVGEPFAYLKRHDIVQIIESNGSVAKVKALIQSDDATIEEKDNINAVYKDPNGKTIIGYVNLMNLAMPQNVGTDKPREVAELAYSRLGIRGVYSQDKRYIDYYLDCAALCAWCWYQVGVDMSQYGTNCHGLSDWADNNDCVFWESEQSKAEPALEVSNWKKDHFNPLLHPAPDTLYFTERSKFGAISENNLVHYPEKITADVFNSMQPGDIILFNKVQTVHYKCSCGTEKTFTWAIDESGKGGYDHAAMFVGMRDGIAIIIESSSPSTDPGKNTKISQISMTDKRINDIVKVIRPK